MFWVALPVKLLSVEKLFHRALHNTRKPADLAEIAHEPDRSTVRNRVDN